MSHIFIMSSERSGSNLLRKMLGMHSELTAPPPPHLWRHLTTAAPSYGPLTKEENLRSLIVDAVSMTQVKDSHLCWKHEISADEVNEKLEVPNVTGVISALYNIYAAREGTERWVCKENNLFDHAHQIRAVHPNSKFLYLCRDGRDVACSVKKVPSHDQHIYHIAKEWKREQNASMRVFQELSAIDQAIIVRYEDLIEDPEDVLHRICNFVRIEYQENMMRFHISQDSKREAEKTQYWENLSKAVMSDNKGKFFRELRDSEVRIFETVAGDTLTQLGYPLSKERQFTSISTLQRLWYSFINRVKVRRMAQSSHMDNGKIERQRVLSRIYGDSHGSLVESKLTYDRSAESTLN